MPTITIDNKTIHVVGKKTILNVAKEQNIAIPHLCYYEELIPFGGCRLCLVEIKTGQQNRLISACTYPVEEGLIIQTSSPRVIEHRKIALEFLLSICPSSKILQDYAKKMGVEKIRFPLKNEDCISCGLCVRICREIANKNIIGFVNKGYRLKVSTLFEKSYSEICKKCGACLFTCPTNKINLDCLNPDESIFDFQKERLENLRRYFLTITAKQYPLDAIRKFPNKLFHKFITYYHLEKECKGKFRKNLIDDSHPYIYVDMSRCIACQTCIRVCKEIEGRGVWRIKKSKDKFLVCVDGKNLFESSCVSCGACANSCPTGAIEDKSIFKFGEPEKFVKTTCGYCGVGCQIKVGVKNNTIITIKPSDTSIVNKGQLCVKGRYAFNYIYSPDRIKKPLIKTSTGWQEISLPEAIKIVAEKLKQIKQKYGPDSIAILSSSRMTNEENYLAQKFARVVIETNNIDCCARVCHAPTAAALAIMLGTGAATNSFEDIEVAKTIMVAGANPTENHPVVGARIKQAVQKGANLIVIDPRKTELASLATLHLQIEVGTDIPLYNAMGYIIIKEKLYDEKFIQNRVNGFDEFSKFLQDYTPENVAKICKINAKKIYEASYLYATCKPAYTCTGLGLSEHFQGTETVCALVNLALLTGNIGKIGCGINPLRGQNNVQGAAHMGCVPNKLTGFVNIEEGKALFEKIWQKQLPATQGKDAIEIIELALGGKIKALYIIGWDILLTHPNATKTLQALKNVEFIVIQDLFINKTAQEVGNIFLPCASNFEKEGTFMNAERRICKVNKVVEPPNGIKTDWEIICMLAKEMGYEKFFNFYNSNDIWEEIRKVWKAGEAISYKDLENDGIQWPATKENPKGTPILHTTSFPKVGKATFRCVKYNPPPPKTNYQFKLITGRTLYQFNAGTQIARTNNTKFYPTDYLLISPQDAKRLKLRSYEKVKVTSEFGSTIMQVKIDKMMKKGELFATFHYLDTFTNRITGYENCDPYTHTPSYKLTYVNIEKV